jgi:hypothetical protein
MSPDLVVLTKNGRRQSSGTHLSRPRVRQSKSRSHEHPVTDKLSRHQTSFATHYSSEDDGNDGDDDDTMVHCSSDEIVESPQHHPGFPSSYHAMTHSTPPRSALKEGLLSAPRFRQKNLSEASLDPPQVSVTNAVSKDLTKPSTSVEQAYMENVQSIPSSEPQIPPSSNATSQFISITPPIQTSQTPDVDMTGLRRNRSFTSLATNTQDHATIPLTTALQGKLTRTQQKLLLQRASVQHPVHPFNLISAMYVSPSLQHTSYKEATPMSDYFSPLPSTTQTTLTPGLAINVPYDVKVAREFDRISRELVNVRRFGDPTGDAITRLRNRIRPAAPATAPKTEGGLNKKPSAFGLNVSWKRSLDDTDATRSVRRNVNVNNMVLEEERKNRVQEVLRQLWYDEVDVADIAGLGGGDDDEDDEEEVIVRKPKIKGTAWSH